MFTAVSEAVGNDPAPLEHTELPDDDPSAPGRRYGRWPVSSGRSTRRHDVEGQDTVLEADSR